MLSVCWPVEKPRGLVGDLLSFASESVALPFEGDDLGVVDEAVDHGRHGFQRGGQIAAVESIPFQVGNARTCDKDGIPPPADRSQLSLGLGTIGARSTMPAALSGILRAVATSWVEVLCPGFHEFPAAFE